MERSFFFFIENFTDEREKSPKQNGRRYYFPDTPTRFVLWKSFPRSKITTVCLPRVDASKHVRNRSPSFHRFVRRIFVIVPVNGGRCKRERVRKSKPLTKRKNHYQSTDRAWCSQTEIIVYRLRGKRSGKVRYGTNGRGNWPDRSIRGSKSRVTRWIRARIKRSAQR